MSKTKASAAAPAATLTDTAEHTAEELLDQVRAAHRSELEAADQAGKLDQANNERLALAQELDDLKAQFARQEAQEANRKAATRLTLATTLLQGMFASRVGLANFNAIPEPQRRLMTRTALEFADILVEQHEAPTTSG